MNHSITYIRHTALFLKEQGYHEAYVMINEMADEIQKLRREQSQVQKPIARLLVKEEKND